MSRYSSIPKPQGGVKKAPAAKKARVASPSRIVPATKVSVTRKGLVTRTSTATTVYPVRPTVATAKNLAGGDAHLMSTKLEIASLLMTSLMASRGDSKQASFYETEFARIKRLEALIKLDPTFAAKALIWARHVAGLRTISHIGAAKLSKLVKGESWTAGFFENIVKRPDDMVEICAAYRELEKSNYIPNALKKGLRRAFGKFDEYQLAKYQMKGKDPSLVDLCNLVHPITTARNRVGLYKLVKGTLANTETWEAKLSAAGQAGSRTTKSQVWRELLEEGQLFPLALLRNLRNIMEDADPDTIDLMIETLTDEDVIAKALILPFQYVSAHKAIESVSSPYRDKVLAALSRAAMTACGNVQPLPGKLCILLDDSGSMGTTAGGAPATNGALFSAILLKTNPTADFMMYNSTARYVSVNTSRGLMALNQDIFAMLNRGGTNLNVALQTLNRAYDNLIILSDEETWQAQQAANVNLANYRAKYNANPTVFGFNLAGNGSLQFPENQVVSIAGFSFEVFRLLNILQKGRSSFVAEIEKIDLAESFRFNPDKKKK